MVMDCDLKALGEAVEAYLRYHGILMEKEE